MNPPHYVADRSLAMETQHDMVVVGHYHVTVERDIAAFSCLGVKKYEGVG